MSANFNGIIGSQTITVVALPLVLKHRYSFCDDLSSTTAHDTAGTAHGILHGGAAFSGFGTLTMNGVDGYVDLPNGIISSLSNATFETWITYNDNRSWARVFDFGSNDAEDTQNAGSNYVYFAARGPANFRFAAKPGNGGESPILFGTGPLATNEEVHVAITYNQMSGVARLYTNGVLIDSGLITVPLSTINDFNNWLGRSQFNDPNFAGSFNFGSVVQCRSSNSQQPRGCQSVVHPFNDLRDLLGLETEEMNCVLNRVHNEVLRTPSS